MEDSEELITGKQINFNLLEFGVPLSQIEISDLCTVKNKTISFQQGKEMWENCSGDNVGVNTIRYPVVHPYYELDTMACVARHVSLTADQINAFSSRIGPNNRPKQPLNDRTVKVDDLVEKVNN